MAGAQPANENPSGLSSLAGRSNLMLRVVSSLVLAPIAIAAAYFGGIVVYRVLGHRRRSPCSGSGTRWFVRMTAIPSWRRER